LNKLILETENHLAIPATIKKALIEAIIGQGLWSTK
jgi:hypothetical protein